MHKFYNKKTYSDVTIITADGNIYAHKMVLYQHSDVLEKMLSTTMSEGINSTVDFSKETVGVVTTVIEYMYSAPVIPIVPGVDLREVILFASYLMLNIDLIMKLIRLYESENSYHEFYDVVTSVAFQYRHAPAWIIVFQGFKQGVFDPINMELDVFQEFYSTTLKHEILGPHKRSVTKLVVLIFKYANIHPEFDIYGKLENVDFALLSTNKLYAIRDLEFVQKNCLMRSLISTIIELK